MKRLLLVLAFLMPAYGFAADLPSPSTTGALNPLVTQSNIDSTICVKGWAKTQRPPAYYTNRLKKQQLAELGFADDNPKHYEEDHLIPLELGGNPTDPRNLWPEPWHSEWSAKRKDVLENKLHKLVCSHEISLAEGQEAIAKDWRAAFGRYVDEKKSRASRR